MPQENKVRVQKKNKKPELSINIQDAHQRSGKFELNDMILISHTQ